MSTGRLSTLVARADRQRAPGCPVPAEHTRRELRRRTLKAVAVPGHQVAFGSPELPRMPVQCSLSLVDAGAVVVHQVPCAAPLRLVEPSAALTRRLHAERHHAGASLHLHENIARYGRIALSRRYPCVVNDTALMDPAPVPRQDVAGLHQSPTLHLFAAGREQRVYAVPPYTDVTPLERE